MNRKLKILCGNASRQLALNVCKVLSVKLGEAEVGRFADGEVKVQIGEDVRGKDVFIINSTQPPAENFLELAFLVDAARRASADRITMVVPLLGCNRQDRKDRPRVPINAKIMIDFLDNRGADRVLLFDLHSEPTMGYFENAVVDHLYCSAATLPYVQSLVTEPFVVASPDKGGGPRAEAYARLMGEDDFVFFFKSRRKDGTVKKDRVKIVGNIEGRNVILVDDIIDTAGTIEADSKAANEAGARDVYVVATHALFSGDALKKIADSPIKEIIITDTIHNPELSAGSVKITTVSIAPLMGQAIRRIHEGESVSSLILAS